MTDREKTDYIVVHCSDTYPNMDIGVDEIRRWHVEENGWSDVGYHYIIKRDGTLQSGRDEMAVGAHARGYNSASVGVCMVGGRRDNDTPDANFTLAQYVALDGLLADLQVKHPAAKVVGHRDLDKGKTCPNFDPTNFLGV